MTCRSRSSSATTTPRSRADLARLRERAGRAGVFLDFDGSLSEIVARPELARPVEGAMDVLGALARRYRVVAIVTGRRSGEVAALLPVRRLEILGVYGLEGAEPELPDDLLRGVEAAAATVPGARVEPKGVSIAVHYRQAPDPDAARAALLEALRAVATEAGLELVEGKMVLELSPPDRPMKGGAIERAAERSGLEAVLYAGDDIADLDAFAGLDRLAVRGIQAIRVAVRGAETPAALIAAADEVVEGPSGLLELLRRLV